MRTRHARQIRDGIRLFRLNWPRFSYRYRIHSFPFLTMVTWQRLERRAEGEVTHG